MSNKVIPLFLLVFLVRPGHDMGDLFAQKSVTDPAGAYKSERIPQQTFDEESWREITGSVNYFEKEAEQQGSDKSRTSSDPNGNQGGEMERSASERSASGTVSNAFGWVLKGIAIAAVVVLLVLLVRAIMLHTGRARNKKVGDLNERIQLAKIEDKLEEAELQDPIAKAIAMGDYPLAMRLYYLACLQSLAQHKWIRWKKEKTNWEYHRELSNTPFLESFRELTLWFDQVWYGGFPLDKERFEQIQVRVDDFLRSIEAQKPQTRSA